LREESSRRKSGKRERELVSLGNRERWWSSEGAFVTEAERGREIGGKEKKKSGLSSGIVPRGKERKMGEVVRARREREGEEINGRERVRRVINGR
jgi:hypothetical protein